MNVLLKLGHWKIVYESALIVWILFGLGYLVMIINIISEGLTRPGCCQFSFKFSTKVFCPFNGFLLQQ